MTAGARRWLCDLAIQLGLSALTTAMVFRLWDRPLRVPFVYTGDALTQASVVDGIVTTGWWFTNPRLGAPEGFVGYDFPLGGEMAHYGALKVGTWFTGDVVLLTNLYFLAGFVLVALASLIALRLMGVGRPLSQALALLFAFAPYHLLRGTEHLTLAAYWSVPLGALAVWWVLQERAPFVRVDAHERPWRLHRVRSRRSWLGGLAVVGAVAFGGAYYAVFTALGLGVAGVLVAVRHRHWKPAVPALVVVAAIGILIVASAAPSLAYWSSNGRNPEAGQRPLSEQDVAPLRPIQLLTPVPEHRFDPLDDLGERLLTAPSNSEPSQFLGLVGSVGLVLALGSVVVAVGARGDRPRGPVAEIGVVMVTLMLTGVAGGFDWLTGLAGLTEIRAWGRVSIVLAFWSLVTVAVVVERWMRRRPRPVWQPAAMAVLIGVVGLADQVPSVVPDPRPNRGEFFADQRFYGDLEARLDPGAMVFQLPYASYPEAPKVNGLLAPAELLRPLVHTDALRWSFGAMRGRDADWMVELSRRPTGELVDALAALGYSAVTVDRAGYPDRATELEADLAATLGPPTVSETGRVVWFDLRAHRAALEGELGAGELDRRATEIRTAPTFWFTEGFQLPVPAPDGDQRWAGRTSLIEVWNRTDAARAATVQLEVRTLSPIDDELTVTSGDGGTLTVPVPVGRWVRVEVPVVLQPGRTPLRLRVSGPGLPGDVREVHLVVRNPVAVVG